MSELSLVFFTVLAQSSVGIFCTLGFVELMAKPNEKAMTRAFVASLVLLAVAALASVTHLGQPLRMLNVLFGLEHASALSLEVVALSLFGGSVAAYIGLRIFNLFSGMRNIFLPIAMLFGLVFIFAFTNVYTLETVPVWNSKWTLFQFLMTALVVGPIGAAALLRWQSEDVGEYQLKIDKVLGSVALIALIVSITGYMGYLYWLGQLEVHSNPLALMDYHAAMSVTRIAFLMAGLVFAGISAMRGQHKMAGVTTACFMSVVAAELMGRIFFFDSYISASSGM